MFERLVCFNPTFLAAKSNKGYIYFCTEKLEHFTT